MPTNLGRKFSTNWKGKPGHMLAEDIPVWYRFLEKYSKYFIAVYYDCLLGGPFLSPEQEKDPLQRMWRYNTSKRADVIAETKSEVWIIEVADDPGLRAAGQLVVYESLWREDPKIAKPVIMVLVCEKIDKDLAAAFAGSGIQIYVT